MDFRKLDSARRNSTAVEVDHIEAFAQGRISRRDFVARGSVIGLSVPFMASIIAACGSDGGSGESAATTAAGETATTAAAAAGALKPGGTLRVANQRPSGPVDPVAMDNLGAYTVVTIPYEYLCGPGEGAELAPMLAESWKPNADGSVWTFSLRKGVKWHDGTPFTADDVVATLDRLSGKGLKASIAAGASKAIDPNTVEVTLLSPDGQFPYLVSNWNPQSVITPKSFTDGSTVDKATIGGTGPFKLTKYDAATGASFVRNDDWWGGKPILDGVELIFSDDPATQISGLQGGAADAMVQFPVIGGDAIFNDPNFVVEGIKGASHRQLWMNVREGQFKDKRVRQAIALGLDRPAIIDTVLKGKGDLGNDHPIAPVYAYHDKSQPQRVRDVAKAKALLAEAGANLKFTFHAVNLQEIGKTAEVIVSQLKELGAEITLNVESSDTFYDQWCKVYDSKVEPAGCDGGQEIGLVDYGNRATPDVYLVKAYSTGEWNSAHFNNADFNAAVKEYQASLDTSGRAAAAKKIQAIATEEVPYAIPYFVNSLTAYSKKVGGIKQTGLGHYYLGKAGFLA